MMNFSNSNSLIRCYFIQPFNHVKNHAKGKTKKVLWQNENKYNFQYIELNLASINNS